MPNWYDIRKSPAGQVGGMALKGLLNLSNPLEDVPPDDLDSPYNKLNYPEQQLPKTLSPASNIAEPLGPISQATQPSMAVSHVQGIRPVSSHNPLGDFLRQDPTLPTEDDDINQRADQIINQSRVSNFTPPTQKTTSSPGPVPPMGVLSSMPRGALDAPDDALAALRGMGANQGLQLAGLQEGRASEMKRNLDLQQRFPDQIWTGATPSDVSSLERDIKQNPYSSQNAAARQFEDIARQREAQAGGFKSPQEAAAAQRQMEMYKLQGPERVAGIEQQGGLERQREASRGALAVSESKGAQQENFWDTMARMRAAGITDVSRVSAPGGGSVSFQAPQQTPPVLLNQITAARSALEAAKSKQSVFPWMQDLVGPAQKAFDQTVVNAFSRTGAPPDIQEWVRAVISNPKTANMPLDQLLSDPNYIEGTPNEVDLHWINQLLSLARGK
jgi:hypothetical protein